MLQQVRRATVKQGEQGSVLLIILMLLLLVTMIGLASMDNSVMELKIAGNDRVAKRNFYNAEAGLFNAVTIFDRIYSNETDGAGNRLYTLDATHPPLRDREPKNEGVAFPSVVTDASGTPLAWIEVRAIVMSSNREDSSLSASADAIPSVTHVGPAPKGYDKALYRSRRFAITATAIDPSRYNAANPTTSLTGISLQCGVDMAEELDKVQHLLGL
jgi:Tfp pilus assembly protein PilX